MMTRVRQVIFKGMMTGGDVWLTFRNISEKVGMCG